MRKIPRAIKTSDGYELLSDDRKLKVVLRTTIAFMGKIQQESYTAYLYVKNDGGWVKVDMSYTYRSREEFLRQFVRAGAFTDAFKELKENYINEVPED